MNLGGRRGRQSGPLGLAMSKLPGFRRILAPGLLLALLTFPGTSIADEPAGKLGAPAGADGRVFALIAGVDEYQYVPQLNGAVADAQDIERSLHGDGVTQITTLLNAAVTRAAITKAMADIVSRARRGDLVILTFAGHGAQEDAKVVTKDNGGYDEVFILAGFDDDDGPHMAERLIDKEIFNWLSQLDAQGVAVIFLADTCHSGGLSKTIDPRIGHVGVRALRAVKTRGESNPAAGTYYAGNDPLRAQTAQLPEAPATDDLKGLTFLAAVDKWTESPEVRVSPEPTPRGAISYAFARALEGDADYDDDGKITRRELLKYMTDKTRDLTHNQQNPEFAPHDASRLDDVLFTLGPPGAMAVANAGPAIAKSVTANTTPAPAKPPAKATASRGIGRIAPIKIGVINGRVPAKENAGTSLTAFSLAEADGKTSGFDAVWDASNGDVIDWLGDIMARRVHADELGGVADRIAAVEKLQLLAQSASARIGLVPSKPSYRAKEVARLQVEGADGRYLIVADITGDGALQFVYPLQGDAPLVLADKPGEPKVIGDIFIKPPFGSDAVVAIASKERLTALEELLIRRQDKQAAREFVDALAQLPPGSADISFLSFVTEP